MKFTLELFANNKYNILKLRCDNQLKVKDDFYDRLSQQKILYIEHISMLKKNKILNDHTIMILFSISMVNEEGI